MHSASAFFAHLQKQKQKQIKTNRLNALSGHDYWITALLRVFISVFGNEIISSLFVTLCTLYGTPSYRYGLAKISFTIFLEMYDKCTDILLIIQWILVGWLKLPIKTSYMHLPRRWRHGDVLLLSTRRRDDLVCFRVLPPPILLFSFSSFFA